MNFFVVGYNTAKVKRSEIPATYEGFTDPKWKGRIALEATDAEWMATLIKTSPGDKGCRSRCASSPHCSPALRKGHVLLASLVAAGDVPVGLAMYNSNIETLKRKGAPIDYVPVQPVVARPQGIGVATERAASKRRAAVCGLRALARGAEAVRIDGPRSGEHEDQERVQQFPFVVIDPVTVLDEVREMGQSWNDCSSDASRVSVELVPRYRFDTFMLSPRRRLLVHDGRELPLIPRYFDLLVFLVERRHEAVHRREIFDRVWSDVVVSDSALSQAIRTLRRTLDEDPREPRFIRTVSRYGYRFVFPDVVEEEDDEAWPTGASDPSPEATPTIAAADPFEPLLDRLTRMPRNEAEEEDRREAAELLHALGTAEALRRLGDRPGHAAARALLRDVRWDSPQAAGVPVLGSPAPLAVSRELVCRPTPPRCSRWSRRRWAGAAIGGGVAGVHRRRHGRTAADRRSRQRRARRG